jgi:hypothetical protein
MSTPIGLSPFGRMLGLNDFKNDSPARTTNDESSPFGLAAENNIPETIHFENQEYYLVPMKLPR